MGYELDVDYLAKNWLALVSLVVACIAAIPGVVALLQERRYRTKFSCQLLHMISGECGPTSNFAGDTFVLLTLRISNAGVVPLTPAHFGLACKVGGKWHAFEKTMIPPNATFLCEGLDIDLGDPASRDLANFSEAIGQGIPVNRFAMFISRTVSLDAFREDENADKLKMRMTCVDAFDKRHTVDIRLALDNAPQPIAYPSHGVITTPRKALR